MLEVQILSATADQVSQETEGGAWNLSVSYQAFPGISKT